MSPLLKRRFDLATICSILFWAMLSSDPSNAQALLELGPNQPYSVYSSNGKFKLYTEPHCLRGIGQTVLLNTQTLDTLWRFDRYLWGNIHISDDGERVVNLNSLYYPMQDMDNVALTIFYGNGTSTSWDIADFVEGTYEEQPETISWLYGLRFNEKAVSFTLTNGDQRVYLDFEDLSFNDKMIKNELPWSKIVPEPRIEGAASFSIPNLEKAAHLFDDFNQAQDSFFVFAEEQDTGFLVVPMEKSFLSCILLDRSGNAEMLTIDGLNDTSTLEGIVEKKAFICFKKYLKSAQFKKNQPEGSLEKSCYLQWIYVREK